MRWRNRLLAGGAAVGAAALVNALISRAAAPRANALGGEEGWFD